MQTAPLGKDGLHVSRIGLGTWSFAGSYGPTDEAESVDTLRACLDLGINFLDTAKVYGDGISEEIIDRFIKEHKCEFVIATKGGIHRDPETGVRSFRNDGVTLRGHLESSLKRLGVEHVPLYYMHKRQPEIPIEDVMEAMVRFKDEGKIGAIGLCEVSPATLRVAHSIAPVAAVQSEYSLCTRYPDLGVLQTCKELGIAFVPFSPLGRGLLTGSMLDPARLNDGDFRKTAPRFSEPNLSRNLQQVAGFNALAADMGTTPSALAIAWCLARGENMFPIPGTRSRAHLTECVRGADLKLTADQMAEIENVLPVGWAHGARYSDAQSKGVENYC